LEGGYSDDGHVQTVLANHGKTEYNQVSKHCTHIHQLHQDSTVLVEIYKILTESSFYKTCETRLGHNIYQAIGKLYNVFGTSFINVYFNGYTIIFSSYVFYSGHIWIAARHAFHGLISCCCSR